MNALSIHQPWATLLAAGSKKIETGHQPYQGNLPCVLAIHAARCWDRQQDRVCRLDPYAAALELLGYRTPQLAFVDTLWRGGADAGDDPYLPGGAVVGLVRLVECVGTASLRVPGVNCLAQKYLLAFPEEKFFSDYSVGLYAWVADRFHAFDAPVLVSGPHGLFDWQPTEEAGRIAAEWLREMPGAEETKP